MPITEEKLLEVSLEFYKEFLAKVDALCVKHQVSEADKLECLQGVYDTMVDDLDMLEGKVQDLQDSEEDQEIDEEEDDLLDEAEDIADAQADAEDGRGDA